MVVEQRRGQKIWSSRRNKIFSGVGPRPCTTCIGPCWVLLVYYARHSPLSSSLLDLRVSPSWDYSAPHASAKCPGTSDPLKSGEERDLLRQDPKTIFGLTRGVFRHIWIDPETGSYLDYDSDRACSAGQDPTWTWLLAGASACSAGLNAVTTVHSVTCPGTSFPRMVYKWSVTGMKSFSPLCFANSTSNRRWSTQDCSNVYTVSPQPKLLRLRQVVHWWSAVGLHHNLGQCSNTHSSASQLQKLSKSNSLWCSCRSNKCYNKRNHSQDIPQMLAMYWCVWLDQTPVSLAAHEILRLHGNQGKLASQVP